MAGARRFCHRAPSTYQPTYKPGSVGHAGKPAHVTAIPLGRRSPGASSNLPGRQDPDADPDPRLRGASRRPYSVLLPVGFAVPPTLPPTRCALTAPFHPCRPDPPACAKGQGGGLLSVALSLKRCPGGLGSAGRYPAPLIHGARTFLPDHLSALAGAAVRPTDADRNGGVEHQRQGQDRAVSV